MANLITGNDCTNLLDLWLESMQHMEAPMVFGRWSFATAVGAMLERNTWIQFGPMRINPNMYTMIVGNSGSRKSTAIKLATKMIRQAGYSSVAAEKTSKEKFLLDLEGDPEKDEEGKSAEEIANEMLAEHAAIREASCCFIAADEFNEFTGNGNIEFFSLLGSLWDYEGLFRQRVKNSKSVEINNPCISILGGNTTTNLSLLFPPEAQGQGFLSRLLFIQGSKTSRKVTIPPEMSEQDKLIIVQGLDRIKLRCTGALQMTQDAFNIIDGIYKEWDGLDDMRFASYGERRLTHLLKLIMICVALRVACEEDSEYEYIIKDSDAIYANSMLTSAEYNMPDALGEYGRAKNWTTQQKILEFLENHFLKNNKPALSTDIFSHIQTDITSMKELPDLLQTLLVGKKIKTAEFEIDGKKQTGYIKTTRPKLKKLENRFDLNLLWEIRHNVE